MPGTSFRILAALSLALAPAAFAMPAHAQTSGGGIIGPGVGTSGTGVQVQDDQNEANTKDIDAHANNIDKSTGTQTKSLSTPFSNLNGSGGTGGVQNAMPQTSEVDSWLISGSSSGSTAQATTGQGADGYAQTIQQQNTSAALGGSATLPAGGGTGGTTNLDPQAGLMLQQLKTAAAIQGMASANLDAIATRVGSDTISSMESDYGQATTVTQVAAYNGRMLIENMITEAQAAQAANLAAIASAQAEINRINRQQTVINDYSGMQGLFSGISLPSGTGTSVASSGN